MTTYRPILATNETYHVYNRTIGNTSVFSNYDDLNKFLEIVNYYRYQQRIKLSEFKTATLSFQHTYLQNILKQTPLIDINVFSFMPNHFHFLLKQLEEKGISRFLSNIQNSFAKNFNRKNERDGGLFKNSFKAKRIISNEEFIHVSRYIHLNHVTSRLLEFDQLLSYEWTSLPCYLNRNINKFVNTKPILDYFKTSDKYINFLKNNVDYQRKLKEIKELMLD